MKTTTTLLAIALLAACNPVHQKQSHLSHVYSLLSFHSHQKEVDSLMSLIDWYASQSSQLTKAGTQVLDSAKSMKRKKQYETALQLCKVSMMLINESEKDSKMEKMLILKADSLNKLDIEKLKRFTSK